MPFFGTSSNDVISVDGNLGGVYSTYLATARLSSASVIARQVGASLFSPIMEDGTSSGHEAAFHCIFGAFLQSDAELRNAVVRKLWKQGIWTRVVELCSFPDTWRLAVPCLRFLQQLLQDQFGGSGCPPEFRHLCLTLPSSIKKQLLELVSSPALVKHAAWILKYGLSPSDHQVLLDLFCLVRGIAIRDSNRDSFFTDGLASELVRLFHPTCFTYDTRPREDGAAMQLATIVNIIREEVGAVLLNLSSSNADRQSSLARMGVLELCAAYLLDPDITKHPATRFRHITTCAALVSNLIVRVRAIRVRAYLLFPNPMLLIIRWLRIRTFASSVCDHYLFFGLFGAMGESNSHMWLLREGISNVQGGEREGPSNEAMKLQGDQLFLAFANSNEAVAVLCEYLSCDISSTQWDQGPEICLRGLCMHTLRTRTCTHKHTQLHRLAHGRMIART
jgi:hypothetical protein